ncbi:hypothetical protein BDF19DRAFT_424331 [Syncephalis fuscata]|nr:hypothetical protein BDF19DRAFT_424331 [Syncephalis fuscata]
MWPSRQQDNTDDTSPLLPSNWPHLLPAPNQSGSLSQPDKVLDALLPQRRLSAPEICTQAKDSIELRRYSDTMKDCKASGWLKQQELLKTLDDTLTTPSNQQKSTANDKTESTAMNPMEQEVPSLTASISLTHSNSNNNTTNENNNNTDLPMTATATIENGHSSVSNANSTALVNKMDYEEEEGEISDMNSNNIDHDDNNDHHSVFNF